MVAVKHTSPLVIDSNGRCADWGQRFQSELHVPIIIHGSVHVHFSADQHLLEINLILQVKDEFQQPAKVFQNGLYHNCTLRLHTTIIVRNFVACHIWSCSTTCPNTVP